MEGQQRNFTEKPDSGMVIASCKKFCIISSPLEINRRLLGFYPLHFLVIDARNAFKGGICTRGDLGIWA